MQVPADDASIAGGQEDESDGSRIVDGQSGAGNQAGGGSAEAEVAKIYLALFNEHPDFYRELTINGSLLTVSVLRWIAQDPGHLYKVFDSFLKDLSLFFHTINFLGPRYPFPS
ncbi:hypothetical protein H920_02245 [Fukomys damarensis]|uniref:Uncharacterized protein n=1 Tax=Fukomys damarensis TaxID=885580 RepID=A0A091EL97_FUKDA|nr:hypothetical protein H920_02245 [Fukomys damarensis]